MCGCGFVQTVFHQEFSSNSEKQPFKNNNHERDINTSNNIYHNQLYTGNPISKARFLSICVNVDFYAYTNKYATNGATLFLLEQGKK